jgi:hypothetical protein
MSDNIETIEDLDLETGTEIIEEDNSSELTDHIDDDETLTGYEDHLSEAIVARIREYVPAQTQYAGEAGNGYVECLTEKAERINDDSWVTTVGVALVKEDLASKAQELRGTLAQQFVGSGQLFELGYRYIENVTESGFFYFLSLDGRYVKGFKNLALAHLAYDMLVDHQPERFDTILEAIISIFFSHGVRLQEDKREQCSEEFMMLVHHLTQEYLG